MQYAPLFALAAVGFALAAWMIFRETPLGVAMSRIGLGRRAAEARMADMLLLRQVPVSSYVKAVPAAELRRQLATCQACPDQARCEHVLAGPDDGELDLTFCPNDVAISTSLKLLR